MNDWKGIGRLTRDPEIKGKAVQITLAIPRGKDNADFVRCAAFGDTGAMFTKYLHKGNRVAVSGNIHTSDWESKDGKKQHSQDVYINHVEFLEPKKKTEREDDAYEQVDDYEPF